ncbi:MAG: hypothetical protein WBG38_07590 [Nodosilinea sp.]
MLLYLRLPKRPKERGPDPPKPEPMSELVQNALARHHQAAASKTYQRAKENYFCERRFVL